MAANSQLAKLQADVDSLVEQLRAHDIPYHFPESVDKQHSTKYRLAGHTKGNTKNQRKKMRRQHLKFLTDSQTHLKSTLDAATVTTVQTPQTTSGSRSTQKDEDLDEEETQNLIQQAQKTLQSPNPAMVDSVDDDDRQRQHHHHHHHRHHHHCAVHVHQESMGQLDTSSNTGHTPISTNKLACKAKNDRHCVENDTSTDESDEDTPAWMSQFVPSLTD